MLGRCRGEHRPALRPLGAPLEQRDLRGREGGRDPAGHGRQERPLHQRLPGGGPDPEPRAQPGGLSGDAALCASSERHQKL